MFDLFFLFDKFHELVTETIRGQAPWWVYFIIIFIPLCIIYTIREIYCWFSKANRIASRIEKLDKRLMILNASVEEITRVIKQEIQRNKIHASGNHIKNVPSTTSSNLMSDQERESEFKEALNTENKS